MKDNVTLVKDTQTKTNQFIQGFGFRYHPHNICDPVLQFYATPSSVQMELTSTRQGKY